MSGAKAHLVYLMNTEYPNRKAHSVQLTKLLASLAPWYTVDAYFAGLTVPPEAIHQAAKEQYGHSLDHVRFHEAGKGSMTGLRFFLTLWRILKETPPDAFFYTRKFGVASKIIATRFLHGRKVVIESHKKDGYLKEERVESNRYAHIRGRWEKEKRGSAELRRVYRNADLVLFTSPGSEAVVRKDEPGMASAVIWYPLDPKHGLGGERPRRFVYCGSLMQSKLIDMLLDALAACPPEITVDCYGGKEADLARVRGELAARGLENRFILKGWLPYTELERILPQYQYGLTTMEGIKVVDYLEYGVIPLCSRVNTYTGVFGDAFPYFTPDSPESLARLMCAIDAFPLQPEAVNAIIERYSLPRFGATLHTLFSRYVTQKTL